MRSLKKNHQLRGTAMANFMRGETQEGRQHLLDQSGNLFGMTRTRNPYRLISLL